MLCVGTVSICSCSVTLSLEKIKIGPWLDVREIWCWGWVIHGKTKCTQEGIHLHWHSASRVHQNHLTEASFSFLLLLFMSFCSFERLYLVPITTIRGGVSSMSLADLQGQDFCHCILPHLLNIQAKRNPVILSCKPAGNHHVLGCPLPLLYLTPLLHHLQTGFTYHRLS